MKQNLFELAVAVPSKSGSTKIVEYGLNGLTYVEGRRGQPYSLKLRNDSAQRVLAVISIDGLNVLDGEPCTPQSRGYVLAPYSTSEIKGWRTNLTEVHGFNFKIKKKSYSAGSGNGTQNCGVIATMIFSEKVKPLPPPVQTIVEHHHHYPRRFPIITPTEPWWGTPVFYGSSYTTQSEGLDGSTQYTADLNVPKSMGHSGLCCANNVSRSSVPKFELGTGWGTVAADSVTETSFERDVHLGTITLFYAEGSALKAIGIQLEKPLAVTPTPPVLPQAFTGFCKPPVS